MNRTTAPNYEELLQLMMVIQAKVDSIQEQTVNCSFLLEYLIEKMNNAATSGAPGDLMVTADEFTAFYENKKQQLRKEWTEAMEQRLSSQNKHELNLDE